MRAWELVRKRHHWFCSGISIVNFEHTSQHFPMSLLLALKTKGLQGGPLSSIDACEPALFGNKISFASAIEN